jgi:hypothetical protein
LGIVNQTVRKSILDYAPFEWKPNLLLGHGNIENDGKPYAILVFILMFALILIWQYFFNVIDIGLAMGGWGSCLQNESVFVNFSMSPGIDSRPGGPSWNF